MNFTLRLERLKIRTCTYVYVLILLKKVKHNFGEKMPILMTQLGKMSPNLFDMRIFPMAVLIGGETLYCTTENVLVKVVL